MNDMRTFKNIKSSSFTRLPAIDQSSAIVAILLVSLGFLSVNNNDHSGGIRSLIATETSVHWHKLF